MFLGLPGQELWPEIERNLSPGQVDMESCLLVTHGSVFPNLSFLENFKTGTDGPGSMCRYIRLTLKVPLAANRTGSCRGGTSSRPTPLTNGRRRPNGPTCAPMARRGCSRSTTVRTSSGSLKRRAEVVAIDGVSYIVAGAHHPRATGMEWPGDISDADRSEHTVRAWLRQWHELMEVGEAPFAQHDEPSTTTRCRGHRETTVRTDSAPRWTTPVHDGPLADAATHAEVNVLLALQAEALDTRVSTAGSTSSTTTSPIECRCRCCTTTPSPRCTTPDRCSSTSRKRRWSTCGSPASATRSTVCLGRPPAGAAAPLRLQRPCPTRCRR